MIYKHVCLAFVLLATQTNSYNILTIFPHPGKSHFDVFEGLLESLARKGHNVTVIGYNPRKDNISNYHDVVLDGEVFTHVVSLEHNMENRWEKYLGALSVHAMAMETCESGLKTDSFQHFLRQDNRFDVILAEFFNSNCFMGLVEKFKAPLIGLSSCVPLPWSLDWFAAPDNPAYIPVVFMDYSDRMSFLERVENTVNLFFTKWFYSLVMDSYGNELSKKYVGVDMHQGPNLMYESSMMLVNTHFSLNLPRPLPPNIVEIGGIHIEKPKPLPEDLEKWISESPEGVIYFSLGSMIMGKTFPEEKRQAFLRAFARLPQRIVWKWENDSMPDQPSNVLVQKWTPQLDILCHKNVRAFISHGGLLGSLEAVHCGVPVIVMPQFGDQHINAKALEANGAAIVMYMSQADEQTIYKNLKKVLHPDFRKKVTEVSGRFKDRPVSPMNSAIYWIEYVARYKGAEHMRTAAVNMPFYQFYLLDVIGFLLFVVFGSLYLFYRIVRIVFGGKGNGKIKQS